MRRVQRRDPRRRHAPLTAANMCFVGDDEFLRRPWSSLHWMHHDDATCLEAMMSAMKLTEGCERALRGAGCPELAGDSRLCITLLWIAAAEVKTFEGLNHSMGGTVGLASGRIRKFVNDLRDGSYLAVDRDFGGFDYELALTGKGWFAAEILRSAPRKN
jgi:hypothetical protein